MNFERFYKEILNIWPSLLDSIGITLISSFFAILIGSIIGFLIGLMVFYGKKPLRFVLWIYLDIIRGTPVLVLMLASFYIFPVVGLKMPPLWAGIIALSFFCSAHIAEVVRGGLITIPKGQTEAAKAIGLTFPKILFWVLLPQLLRTSMPAWVNTAVEIAKGTTLLSVIGVADLMYATQRIITRNFMSAEFYLLAAVIFLAINIAISALGRLIERRIAY